MPKMHKRSRRRNMALRLRLRVQQSRDAAGSRPNGRGQASSFPGVSRPGYGFAIWSSQLRVVFQPLRILRRLGATSSDPCYRRPRSGSYLLPLHFRFPQHAFSARRIIGTQRLRSPPSIRPVHCSSQRRLAFAPRHMTRLCHSTATPNHALQRTAPCVTAPASAAALPPAMQVPRRTPRSLSLGSLGVSSRIL